MNDDWDSVSNDTLPDSKTDDWDAVSTPDLAAAMQRRRRRQPGQPIEEEEPQVIAAPIPDSNILGTGEPLAQPAPVPDMAVPERAFQQAQPEEEIIEAPRREPERGAARPPTRRKGISASTVAIVILSLAVIGLSVFSGLNIYQGVLNHNEKVRATTTAQTKATTTAKADSTATVQAVTTATAQIVATATEQTAATAVVQTAATATAQQQIYNQATSGTPVFSDPLTDNSNNWATGSNSLGSCIFTGSVFHLIQFRPDYWVLCTTAASVTNQNNFALQVQVSIARGDRGGVVFDAFQNSYYQVVIGSGGDYVFVEYTQSGKRSLVLESGTNLAIIKGLNEPNIMTVIVNSGNFYLYVNSRFVISAFLSSYRQGQIGLTAWDYTQRTDVAFSNIKIWTL